MNAPQSLCPGYKHVEAFGPDEEYEEEEEVCYVTLDVGNVEPKLVPSSTAYRLIGLDTPTPFLQLQGTILQGRHDLLLGTELLFTDDKDTHGSKRSVTHVGTTEQRIAFQEVTVTPKKRSEPEIIVDLEPPPAEDLDEKIDRMTGLSVPPTRAPRKKKTGSNAKGKEKATPGKSTRGRKAKGKGKEKEKEKEPTPLPPSPPPLPEGIRMDEDALGGDDDDDMYVDELRS